MIQHLRSKILFIFLISTSFTFAQETKIRFFGQPGFEYTRNENFNKNSFYFRGGSFIMYVTSQINENISVAAELNPHYNHVEGAQIEIERLFVKYYYKDYLSFKLGKMYNPIGFWNQNYNFGLVLQPTISRPLILTPIHDNGFVQGRDVGFQLEGNNLGNLRVFYKFLISNGIGKNGGVGGKTYDLNGNLEYTAQIGFEPFDGLKLLVSGMYNRIEKTSLNQFGLNPTDNLQSIVGNASVVFMNSDTKFEFIGEFFSINNVYENLGTKPLTAALLYGGYKVSDKVIPFVFGQYIKFDDSDEYYKPGGVAVQESQILVDLGVRYRFDANAVLKFAYEGIYGENSKFSHGPRMQFAFAF